MTNRDVARIADLERALDAACRELSFTSWNNHDPSEREVRNAMRVNSALDKLHGVLETVDVAQPNQDSGQPADINTAEFQEAEEFRRCVKEIGDQAASERRHRESLAAMFELTRLRSEWERLPAGETNRQQAFEQFETRVKELAK